MIFDHLDRLCYSVSIPTHNVKKSTTSPDNMNTPNSTPPTKNIVQKIILVNPFGPVVGHIKYVYSCDYRKQRGEMYVSSKAICIRRTTFFGLEVDRVIIPWERVSSIDESDHGVIAIKTDRDVSHEINGFEVELRAVLDSMSDIWKRGKEVDLLHEVSDDAVKQLLRRVSMMSEFNDGDTEASSEATDEDESNLSTGLVSATSDDCEDEIEMSADELARMWSAICDEKDMKYTQNVAMKMRLNIGLNDFHDKFLRDDAVASLVKHHEASGDLDSKTTKWCRTNTNTPMLARKRFLTYSHPINIPLSIAPPAGAATKTQIMRRFPNGICVDTETWISDIPLADCFYVADRLLVESIPASEGGGVWLTVQFGNVFVKRTMFKSIIASTSIRDVTAFHKGYIDLIMETIGIDNVTPLLSIGVPIGVPGEKEEANKTVTGGREKKRLDWNVCLIIILAFISIGNQYMMSKELQEANEKLSRIEMILEQKFGMNGDL